MPKEMIEKELDACLIQEDELLTDFYEKNSSFNWQVSGLLYM